MYYSITDNSNMQFSGLYCQCILPFCWRRQPKCPADSWWRQEISRGVDSPDGGWGKAV